MTRLPEDMIKKPKLLAKEEDIDRLELIRRILDVGIKRFFIEWAYAEENQGE